MLLRHIYLLLKYKIQKIKYEYIDFIHVMKGKVKVTLVQALRLCTGRTAHRGSKGIALLFHDQQH
jgi:hypothetical protein